MAPLVLAGGAVCCLVGGFFFDDARRLRRFRLVIDHRGIASGERPEAVVPWGGLRNVVVTVGVPTARRLLVDDGAVPLWWWKPKIYPGRAQIRQLTSRSAFLVNVPIARLNVGEADIVRAIHHCSEGRFPNVPLPRSRRAP